MSRSISMPRAAVGSDPIAAINALAKAIEQQLRQSPSGRAYSVTNGAGTRTLDASGSNAAAVLGTLIGDLQTGGLIG